MSPENSPKPEATSGGVDERRYELMEEAAKAGGPEAEARRKEMAEYAETAGAYAEKAAKMTTETGESAVKAGVRGDQVASRMAKASEVSAQIGEIVPNPRTNAENPTVVARPSDSGMEYVETGYRSTETFENAEKTGTLREARSPAQIAADEEAKRNPEAQSDQAA